MTSTITSGLMEALSALHDATVDDEDAHAKAHDALLQATSEHDERTQHHIAARWRPGWGSRDGAPLHDAHTDPRSPDPEPEPLAVEVGVLFCRTFRPDFESPLQIAQQVIARVREHDAARAYPRYEGDTLRQYLLDTECAPYEGDGPGMARHLREEHGMIPQHDSPGSEGAWLEVARQHVEAHLRGHEFDGTTLLRVSAGDRDHLRTALTAWLDRLDAGEHTKRLRNELITLRERVSGQPVYGTEAVKS